MKEETLYKIAISLIPNIGDVLAKRLIAYCGSPEMVFKEKKPALEKIPGIGTINAQFVIAQNVLAEAEEEIKFMGENKITPLFYLDKDYPKRLLHCEDGPIMLYYKGNADLNASKMVSVVGTRNATNYGKQICETLITDLAQHNATIVSGLAYGIDIAAHKNAIKNNLPTICVLAHDLNRMYPQEHKSTAEKMLELGGWLTDKRSNSDFHPSNFPTRNRIVAGISDATIVVESKEKGGSLITAEFANSYNRDVFAFPGRIGDVYSEGCNAIIKQNKAALIQSAADIIYLLGWEEKKKKNAPHQKQLFIELNKDEKILVDVIKEKEAITIDDLCLVCQLPMSKVSAMLLTLEFSGVVKSLPGKIYRMN